MTEFGEVVDIKENTAYVRFIRSSACGRCKACGMLANQNEIVVEVPNDLDASLGDRVAVSITVQKAVKASVLAYIFPLFMLLLGVLLGWISTNVWGIFQNTDVTMAVFAIIFVILSFLLLKLAAPLYNKTVNNVYRMVNKKEN